MPGPHPAVFAAPAITGLAMFVVAPAGLALVASFFDLNLVSGQWRFVGLGNYREALTSPDVHGAAWRTLLYLALIVVPAMAIGLIVAAAVDGLQRTRSLMSTLLFLPVTANLVAMSVVFSWIFSARGGFANQVAGLVGIGPIDYIGDERWALPTAASVMVWRSASFAMVLYLAGLTTIPAVVVDAARADGLRGWTRLRRVTWPMLRPTTVLVTVLTVIGGIQTFEAIRLITGGGPLDASTNLLLLTWREGFDNLRLGYASALSMLMLAAAVGIGALRARWIARTEL